MKDGQRDLLSLLLGIAFGLWVLAVAARGVGRWLIRSVEHL